MYWALWMFSNNADDTLPSPAQPVVTFLTTADKVVSLQGPAPHMLVIQWSTVSRIDVFWEPARNGTKVFGLKQAAASGLVATARRAVLHPAEILFSPTLVVLCV